MEVALDPYLPWDDLVLGSTSLGEAMNLAYWRRHGLHKHSPLQDVHDICGPELLNASYCFTLVRDPVDRVCSLYNFVGSVVMDWADGAGVPLGVVRQDLERLIDAYEPLSWPAAKAFIQADSFEEFLARPELAWDDGFKPQASRIVVKDFEIECEALKLETLDSWLPRLSKQVKAPLTLPHENMSGRKLVSAATLPRSARSLIEAMYAEDFERFNY